MKISVELNLGTDQAIRDFVKNNKWGRCCICQSFENPKDCQFFERYDHCLNRSQLFETLGYMVFEAWRKA